LKFHSKKSTHRTDGNEWFTGIIDKLLPANKKTMQQLIDTLGNKKTGVIGPKGEYLSLEVNFPANHRGVVRIMTKIFGKKVGQRMADHKEDYGFVAGTMFWARMDALAPVLKLGLKPWSFDPEEGQIDATIAHALERVFTLIPEVEGRDIYEADSRGVTKVAYNSGHIPDWSKVYIGPQPKS
jgi:lipopolysaccharide biosynthesis protein